MFKLDNQETIFLMMERVKHSNRLSQNFVKLVLIFRKELGSQKAVITLVKLILPRGSKVAQSLGYIPWFCRHDKYLYVFQSIPQNNNSRQLQAVSKNSNVHFQVSKKLNILFQKLQLKCNSKWDKQRCESDQSWSLCLETLCWNTLIISPTEPISLLMNVFTQKQEYIIYVK